MPQLRKPTRGDDDDDDDDINMRSAKALLMLCDSVVSGAEGEDRIDVVDALSKLNGVHPSETWRTLATLIKDVRYFASAGISARWTANDGGFLTVLNGSYAIRYELVHGGLKSRVRGKFKCTLCGQMENTCSYVVHFAGSPPVERGQNLSRYSASDFETADPERISDAYSTYAHSYNESSTIPLDVHESNWPASAYLGIVAPGAKCLQNIFNAFGAKDLVRSAIDEAFESQASLKKPLAHTRVQMLASKISHLRESAAGRRAPHFQNTDDDFWTGLMTRFCTDLDDECDECDAEDRDFERLRASYLRMEHNINQTGYVPGSDDEDEEDDDVEDEDDVEDDADAGVTMTSRGLRKKRTVVVLDDDDEEEDEDEDDEEDDDVEEDDDEEEEDDDDDEDYVDDDETRNKTKPSNAWGATSASQRGPFAKRRRPAEEPFAPVQTRVSHRRNASTRNVVVDVDDDDDTTTAPENDHLLVALRTVDNTTARRLRAWPMHAIGSRRSTVKKLGFVATKILERGDLGLAGETLNALARIVTTLDTHERGAGLSDFYKKRTLKEVSNSLRVVRHRLSTQGRHDLARDVAEAIVVAHELLSS